MQRTNSTHCLVECRLKLQKKRATCSAIGQFGWKRRKLVVGQLRAFGIAQQTIDASSDMPDVECNGCNTAGPRIQLFVIQIAAPALQVLLRKLQRVQCSAVDRRDVSQRPSQPRFRLCQCAHAATSSKLQITEYFSHCETCTSTFPYLALRDFVVA